MKPTPTLKDGKDGNNSLTRFDPQSETLHPVDNNYNPSSALTKAIQEISGLIKQENFPCIGAQQVFNNGRIYIGEYGDLEDPKTAEEVYRDVKRYANIVDIRELKDGDRLKYATFLSSFPNQLIENQLDASKKLYILLKNIIEIDLKENEVADGYSRDPNDRNFAMSVDGVPYFTALFHPLNGNNPRKTDEAIALNWNTHYVFDLLKRRGDHPKWEESIKERLKAKHGEIHPDLVLNGAASELAQYNLVDGDQRNELQKIMQEVFNIPSGSHVLQEKNEYRNDAINKESGIRKKWGKRNKMKDE